MLMRGETSQSRYLALIIATAILAAWISLFNINAANAAQQDFMPETIDLLQGKSKVMNVASKIKRVSLADPEVADIMLLSPTQIYLTGKAPGATNLTLWKNGSIYKVYDLVVSPDVSRLKKTLHEVLPEEKNLKVMTAGGNITLTGTVSSTESLTTAVELAKIYAPEKVSNLLHVGGVHQVMLEVKVAEMNRSFMERLGIDLAYFFDGNHIFTMLNGLFDFETDDTGGKFTYNQNTNGLFSFSDDSYSINGFLDALKRNGLVKILAEPTLICRSGMDASFLAGGEIPIPVPDDDGIAIEYKKFGVSLDFTPKVMSGKRISLTVSPEVSELDFANSISISGTTIPALTSRRAATTVELGDGQSFAIAGLLRDITRENIDQYPILGDIPVLGSLFRSSEFQQSKSELVIIVTPHLAKPLDMASQKLPTDDYTPPSEWEFFMMGKLEGEKPETGNADQVSWNPPAAANSEIGMEGNFGHIIPRE